MSGMMEMAQKMMGGGGGGAGMGGMMEMAQKMMGGGGMMGAGDGQQSTNGANMMREAPPSA